MRDIIIGLAPFLEEERFGNEGNILNTSIKNVTKNIMKTVTYADVVRTQMGKKIQEVGFFKQLDH